MKLKSIIHHLPTISFLAAGAFLAVIFFYTPRPKPEWQTVTHEKYGFSFEYPTEWRVRLYGENGYRNQEELKVLLDLRSNDYFNTQIRVIPINNPTIEEAILWRERNIAQINKLFALRGDAPITELFLRQEELNGQIIARRRYQGSSAETGEVIFYEDVYFVRSNNVVVITLQCRESSFEYFTDEFERVVSSFATVN